VIPRLLAIGRNRCTDSRTSSLRKRFIAQPISSDAARESSGTASPGWYFPLNTPWASGDQTICEIPVSVESATTPVSTFAREDRVLRLARDETLDTGYLLRRADLLGCPLAEPEVTGLALADDLGERVHGFLERRLEVVPMALVEIDVVGAEPLERGVDLLANLRHRETAIRVRHREVELC